jgi:hypothetical protein
LKGNYEGIEPLDLAVLTGRKDFPNIGDYLPTLVPDPENEGEFLLVPGKARPPLSEIPNGDPEDDQMLSVLKFMGLWGMLAKLYASRAITWEEYVECFDFFFGTDEERGTQEILRLKQTLPDYTRPSLSPEKETQLRSFYELAII